MISMILLREKVLLFEEKAQCTCVAVHSLYYTPLSTVPVTTNDLSREKVLLWEEKAQWRQRAESPNWLIGERRRKNWGEEEMEKEKSFLKGSKSGHYFHQWCPTYHLLTPLLAVTMWPSEKWNNLKVKNGQCHMRRTAYVSKKWKNGHWSSTSGRASLLTRLPS